MGAFWSLEICSEGRWVREKARKKVKMVSADELNNLMLTQPLVISCTLSPKAMLWCSPSLPPEAGRSFFFTGEKRRIMFWCKEYTLMLSYVLFTPRSSSTAVLNLLFQSSTLFFTLFNKATVPSEMNERENKAVKCHSLAKRKFKNVVPRSGAIP